MCKRDVLAIDQGPANDEMDPSLFSYGLGWATMEMFPNHQEKEGGST